MKHLLIIHQSAELYGSDKTLLLLLERLDKRQFTPVVILPSEGPLKDRLEILGITVHTAPVLKLYRKIFTPANMLAFLKDIKASQRFLSTLHKKYSFDIVYSNTLAVLAGLFFCRKHNIRHVWHVHEIIVHPKPIAVLYPKLLNRFADTVICNSNATKNNLVGRMAALEKKCVVVYNGLDKSGYEVTGHTEMPLLHKDKITVTLIGRISRLKGHKWLLNTYLNHLRDKNVQLLFVGSPVPGQEYYLDEIKAIIAENGLENEVFIIDFTTNLAPVWAATHIATMPSTEAESFGLVALEAMLHKKPVIASAHGGVAEIVDNGKTGFLVPPGNEKALSLAISALVNNPEKMALFGNAGFERAVTHFSLENYINGITAVLST